MNNSQGKDTSTSSEAILDKEKQQGWQQVRLDKVWNIEKRYRLLFYECFVAQFSCFSLGWPVLPVQQALSCLTFQLSGILMEMGRMGRKCSDDGSTLLLGYWLKMVDQVWAAYGYCTLVLATGILMFVSGVWIAVYRYSVTDLHMGIDRNERVKYVRNCTNNIDFLNHNCESYLDHRFRSYHVFVSLAVTN